MEAKPHASCEGSGQQRRQGGSVRKVLFPNGCLLPDLQPIPTLFVGILPRRKAKMLISACQVLEAL